MGRGDQQQCHERELHNVEHHVDGANSLKGILDFTKEFKRTISTAIMLVRRNKASWFIRRVKQSSWIMAIISIQYDSLVEQRPWETSISEPTWAVAYQESLSFKHSTYKLPTSTLCYQNSHQIPRIYSGSPKNSTKYPLQWSSYPRKKTPCKNHRFTYKLTFAPKLFYSQATLTQNHPNSLLVTSVQSR